jgi:nitrate/nitrite transport system substrate-binding protein
MNRSTTHPATKPTFHVSGSDAPEKTEVRIGFMPLTDCASVLMASVLGFDARHGVRIVPMRQASWAAVRDQLTRGELDLAHALIGLVYGAHCGIGGLQCDMASLMTLDQNGQGITVSRALAEQGAVDLQGLSQLMRRSPRETTWAQTWPTGTHAMWLHYWLAHAGIHPLDDCRIITMPPPQMVDAMRLRQIDGFSVGEPWNHRAILDGVGVSVASSQQVWPDHPEKVLGSTAAFADQHPNTCRAVVTAVLEASRWIDASAANKAQTAETVARVVGVSPDAILPRMLGQYQDGLGGSWTEAHHMRFFDDGRVNYPYLSDGMWFLTQYRRWGLLTEHPDYLGVACRVNRTDLYADAARALGVSVPASPMRSSRLIDGKVWDGMDPERYADSFTVRANPPADSIAAAA